jgi:hypothetical protein
MFSLWRGHRPDSLNRIASHTSDAVVDTDWRRTKAGRAISAIVDRDALDQHGVLWTPGWPLLALAYRVSSERFDGHRQLLDQDSILAHGQFNLWHH